MIAIHLVLWLGIAGAAILSLGIARRTLFAGYDAFGEFALGPGDIDAAHYLSSGRVAWRSPRSGSRNRRRR